MHKTKKSQIINIKYQHAFFIIRCGLHTIGMCTGTYKVIGQIFIPLLCCHDTGICRQSKRLSHKCFPNPPACYTLMTGNVWLKCSLYFISLCVESQNVQKIQSGFSMVLVYLVLILMNRK